MTGWLEHPDRHRRYHRVDQLVTVDARIHHLRQGDDMRDVRIMFSFEEIKVSGTMEIGHLLRMFGLSEAEAADAAGLFRPGLKGLNPLQVPAAAVALLETGMICTRRLSGTRRPLQALAACRQGKRARDFRIWMAVWMWNSRIHSVLIPPVRMMFSPQGHGKTGNRMAFRILHHLEEVIVRHLIGHAANRSGNITLAIHITPEIQDALDRMRSSP